MRLEDREKNNRMTAAQMMRRRPARRSAAPVSRQIPPEGAGEQGSVRHQPDTQEEPEAGEGKGVDVRRLALSQEAHNLFINQLELEEAGVGQFRAHQPGHQKQSEQGETAGGPKQGEQPGLA